MYDQNKPAKDCSVCVYNDSICAGAGWCNSCNENYSGCKTEDESEGE